jgi:hypothetical protein
MLALVIIKHNYHTTGTAAGKDAAYSSIQFLTEADHIVGGTMCSPMVTETSNLFW